MAMGGGPLPHFASALRGLGLGAEGACGRVAVALSGGPDSVALAAMTASWHVQHGSRDPPVALVVDHQLRPESSAEAAQVAGQAAALGLLPAVLRVEWGGAPPRVQDKMEAARAARYALLLGACHQRRLTHLLVAHHADDQAETFLVRLLRGSGVLGLACMAPVTERWSGPWPVQVVRPLLGVRKAVLERYCAEEGLPYVVDPSNADLRHTRNRLRRLLQDRQLAWPLGEGAAEEAAGEGATPDIVESILRLQAQCAKAAAALRQQAARLLRAALVLGPLELERAAAPAAGGPGAVPPPDVPTAWRGRDWGAHLRLLAAALSPARAAVLSVAELSGGEEGARAAALSQVLQAVASREHPPRLADSQAMAAHLGACGGRLEARLNGGGCILRPVTGSAGRYALAVPLAANDAATRCMKQLLDAAGEPPPR